MSLVELMVGITVGLIVSAAAAFMAVNQITEHRRLMAETQIQQDLRAVAAVIQQDIRLAGYRGLFGLDAWAPADAASATSTASPAIANPFIDIQIGEAGDSVTYSYLPETVSDTQPPDKVPDQARFGLKRMNGAIYLQVGLGNWQPLTDPETFTVSQFQVTPKATSVPKLDDFCDAPCPDCVKEEVRQFSFSLTGTSKLLKGAERNLTVSERVGSNAVTLACP